MEVPTLLRQTAAGPVQGFTNTLPRRKETKYTGERGDAAPLDCWLAIPYGKAERWQHVEPPDEWTEPLQCYNYGPMTPQGPSFLHLTFEEHVKGHIHRDQHVQAEDGWATVNVHAPAGTKKGDRLPVLVWVYGGSLNNGSPGLYSGDPATWLRRSIKEGKPFIFVSGSYRVSIFGWLASTDLQKTDPRGLAGNYGLRDALSIFEWVQKNIAEFGGDPENVTGFGESAGAWIISSLLQVRWPGSPYKGKRIMRRAIMQSAGATTIQCKAVKNAFPQWEEMLKELGIEESTPEKRIAALRIVPWNELLKYGIKTYTPGLWCMTKEEGQHAIWAHSPFNVLEEGKFDDSVEAVIIGTNEHEGGIFTTQMQTPAGFKWLTDPYPPEVQGLLAKWYPPPTTDQAETKDLPNSSAGHMFGDLVFHAPVLHTATALASKIPVYVYRLRAVARNISDGIHMGVMHTADLHLLFDLHNYWNDDESAAESRVARLLGNAWVDFATTGVPSKDWARLEAKGSKEWLSGSSGLKWLAIEQDGSHKMEDFSAYRKEKMQFWVNVFRKQAQALSAA